MDLEIREVAVMGSEAQLQALFEQMLNNSFKFTRQNVQSVIKIRTFVMYVAHILV